MSNFHALCRTVASFRPRRVLRLRLSTQLLDAGGNLLEWN